VPGHETETTSGVISYEFGKMLKLELNGEIRPNSDFQILILGSCSNGKIITLYKCLKTSSQASVPGYVTESYTCVICLVSYHYNTEEDIKFNSILFRFDSLNEWLGHKIFKNTKEKSTKDSEIYSIEAKIPKLKIVSFEDIRMSFKYFYSLSYGNEGFSIKNLNPWIMIDFNEAKKLEDIWYYLQNVSSFIDLGIGKRSKLLNLQAIPIHNEERVNNIEIYYMIFDKGKTNEYKSYFMPFVYDEILHDIAKYLKGWFNVIKKYNPTYETLFASFDNPYINPVHEFLTLTQALESFHSRKYTKDYVVPKKEYNKIIKILKKKIDGESIERYYKDFLISRLIHWNSKTLRIRLKELYQNNDNELKGIIKNKNIFIDKIVNTCNYYTHYDKTLEPNIIKGKDLILYNQKLRLIIIILLLKESRFKEDLIKKIIEKYEYLSVVNVY